MHAKLAAMAVLVAVGVTLSSVAAAGPGAVKQRVAIETRILPQGTFVLTPLATGALQPDSGTVSGNWRSLPGRKVMRAGQEVTVYNASWTLTGKQGTLTFRERTEWVAVGGDDGVALGTWNVVRGTGAYARLTGSGGSGHAGLGTPWYARYEGVVTVP
jgi:hypothetical protein